MKILILDTRPLRRGAQVFAHDLSIALSNRGLAVKKVYLYDVKETETLTLNAQDELLGGDDSHFFEKIPTVHPGLLRKLIKSINNWDPDILLLNGSRTLKYGAAAKWWLNKKVKLVYRVIDSALFWNNRRYKQLYYRKLIIPKLDAAAGVSVSSLNDMKSLHQFDKPAVVIHRAIDTRNFDSVGNKSESRKHLQVDLNCKILLFLGNLTHQKRPDRFVEILSEVKKVHPHIQGWMVGDGALRKDLESIILRENLAGSIKLWGYQKQVGPFLAAADILMLTSDTEGLPGVVLEAGYFHVPSISTDVGGIRECLHDSRSGYIVPTTDIEAFVSRTLTLLDDDQLRIRMGMEAHGIVVKSFLINTMAEKYIKFFSTLTES